MGDSSEGAHRQSLLEVTRLIIPYVIAAEERRAPVPVSSADDKPNDNSKQRTNHEKEQSVELLPCSNVAKTAFGASGKYQLGTLGSGNHFIEVAKGEDEKLWLVIHSGSRGFGKIIAEYYMKKACEMKFDKKACEKDFNKKHKKLLEHNKEAFEKSKQKFLAKAKDDFIKANLEGHNGFDINSELGRDYITDMLCAISRSHC